ncbi:MAG: hypothetical protein R3F11_30400 [Verrucomicrobiales bacterium]
MGAKRRAVNRGEDLPQKGKMGEKIGRRIFWTGLTGLTGFGLRNGREKRLVEWMAVAGGGIWLSFLPNPPFHFRLFAAKKSRQSRYSCQKS